MLTTAQQAPQDRRTTSTAYMQYVIARNAQISYEMQVEADKRRSDRLDDAMARTKELFGVDDDILVAM